MRILLVTNTSWNLWHFRGSLIRRLSEEGFEVIGMAREDEFAKRLPELGMQRFISLQRMAPGGKNPVNDGLLLYELRRKYQHLRPDLVMHFTIKPNIYGSMAAGGLGIPAIATLTGLGYTFLHPGGVNRIIPFLYKRAFKKVEAAVFQNQDDRDLFLSMTLVNEGRTHLIRGSGVDVNHFRPRPFMSRHFNFLFIGRLLRDKGVAEFLKAAEDVHRMFPDARFQLIGRFDEYNPACLGKSLLKKYLFNSQLPVEYLGPHSDVRPFIAKSEVLVLPSYREGMPRVVLEAMSMGKPILTTDVPGCRDTVEEGKNGFLVPARNATLLAQRMKDFCRLPVEERRKMGEYSRQKVVAEFSQEQVLNQYIQLIRNLL
jgi:glycosyltransferase involved in cell wall biosynthesis